MTIPIELTEFVPEKIDAGSFRSWTLKADETSDHVDIRTVIFSRKMIAAIVVMVAWMLFIFAIGATAIFMSDPPVKMNHPAGPIVVKLLLTAFAGLACLAGMGILIAILIHSVFSNASLWKDKLRFQYTKSTGELFFPHENVRYSRDDYDELLLGTTDGYNTVQMLEEIELNKTRSKKRYTTPAFVTQSYFIVRRKEGTWHRHLIGYDQHSKATHRAIANIREPLQCRTVKRTMSLPECYITQHKTDGTASKVPQPPKQSQFFHYFCIFFVAPLFMIFGLGFTLYNTAQLLEAKASVSWQTCEGTITYSDVKHNRGGGGGGRRGGGSTWGASIRYDYTVDGKKHTGERYCFGDYSSSNSSRARQIVREHPVGAVVKVYYSPDSPEKSVLMPDANWMVYLLIGMGTAFFLGGVGVVFLMRYFAKSTNLSAAYTPSEPVFG
jgi:hypothetical protein